MATGTIKANGTTSTASGQYTTAAWASGTNTCTWTAPSDGIYIVWMQFILTVEDTANRNAYKQLQMIGTAERLLANVLYYDAEVSDNSQFVSRTISQPVRARQGQTIQPYVHTKVAGIVFNVKIIAMKIA